MHLKASGEVVHLHGDSRSRYLSRGHFVSSYIDARNTTYIGYKPMVNEHAFGSADFGATLRGVDMHLKALGEVVHIHGD